MKKSMYISVAVFAIFLAGLSFAVGEILLFPHVEEAYLAGTQFAVGALVFAEIFCAAAFSGTIFLANSRNLPYAMAFPRALVFYFIVALICVPAAMFLLESRAVIALIHAGALFVVTFFGLGFFTAGTVADAGQNVYETGRKRIDDLRESFEGIVALIPAETFPKSAKIAAMVADDLKYAQESVDASADADTGLSAKFAELKNGLSKNAFSEDVVLAGTLSQIRSSVEFRERVIKQSR